MRWRRPRPGEEKARSLLLEIVQLGIAQEKHEVCLAKKVGLNGFKKGKGEAKGKGRNALTRFQRTALPIKGWLPFAGKLV